MKWICIYLETSQKLNNEKIFLFLVISLLLHVQKYCHIKTIKKKMTFVYIFLWEGSKGITH